MQNSDKFNAQIKFSRKKNKNQKYNYKKPQHGYGINELLSDLGNDTVGDLITGNSVQAKLNISSHNDIFEQEADKIAKTIVNNNTPLINPINKINPLQTKANAGGTSVSSTAESKIEYLKNTGNPLSKPIRDYFEPRFGVDLAHVKIHTDNNSNELAKAINARAFTYGNNIVFDKGEFQPNTHAGKELIAHELTHTIQQANGINRKEKSNEPETIGNTKKKILEAIAKAWPKNVGYIITGQLGATFGYPIYLGGEGKEELFHGDNYNFKLVRVGRATGALDTGAGAEAGFQLGPLKAGASAKAEAQAGLKVMVKEEYCFPMLQDPAFNAFFTEIGTEALDLVSNGALTVGFLLKPLISTLKYFNSAEPYRTSLTLETVGFGAAAASANAKIQFGGDDKKPENDIKKDQNSESYWQSLLPVIFARAGINLEAGMGLEIDLKNKKTSVGFKLYAKIAGSLTAGAGATILKILRKYFSVVDLSLEGAVFIKGEVSTKNQSLKWLEWGVKGSSFPVDDLAAVNDPGSSVELGYNIGANENQASKDKKQLIDSLLPDTLTFEKRAGVGGGFGKGFSNQNRAFLMTHLSDKKYRNYGLILQGEFFFKLKFTKAAIKEMALWIYNFIKGNTAERAQVANLISELISAISTGTLPEWVSYENMQSLFTKCGLDEAKLKTSVGLAISGGASAAEGAKVKLHGGVTATRYRELDLKTINLKKILDYIVVHIREFLTNSNESLDLELK